MILKLIKKLSSINRKNKNLKKSIVLSGKACLLDNKKKYETFTSINEAELKIFSQNGEDGIIDFLLSKMSIQNAKFVEIGVENYEEANTRFIYESTNSKGLIIDNSFNVKELEQELEIWKGRLIAVKEVVTSDNVNDLLKKNNFNNNLDLFSIDIDGVDYWVIEKLPNKISKIFVAEYNPVFGPNLEITVPNQKDFDRTKYHYSNLCWGASLKALINLMQGKGYIFLGTNLLKNNAFFVVEENKTIFNKIIENNDFDDLKKFTEHDFMESRNEVGELTYINKNQQIELIQDCEVINLSSKEKKITKIKELI